MSKQYDSMTQFRLYPHVKKLVTKEAKTYPKHSTTTHVINAILEKALTQPAKGTR